MLLYMTYLKETSKNLQNTATKSQNINFILPPWYRFRVIVQVFSSCNYLAQKQLMGFRNAINIDLIISLENAIRRCKLFIAYK